MMYKKSIFLLALLILTSVLNGCASRNNKNEVINNITPTIQVEQNKSTKTNAINSINNVKTKTIKKINGFVNVLDIDNSLVIDLKYATKDNFTGMALYNSNLCILREETAIKIKRVNDDLKEMGYMLKIYDGYRPVSVQKIMWKKHLIKNMLLTHIRKVQFTVEVAQLMLP